MDGIKYSHIVVAKQSDASSFNAIAHLCVARFLHSNDNNNEN